MNIYPLAFREHFIQSIMDNLVSKVVQFSFPKGKILEKHKTSSHILVLVVVGQVRFKAEKEVLLHSDQLLSLEPNVEHSVEALEDSIMLLILTPSQREVDTIYDAIGGELTIRKLVEAFYPKVYADEHLSPLFTDEMEIIMDKQRLFLTQFTGGPPLYSNQYGPPQMRQRHLDFEVTPLRAKAWLRCMNEAMDDIGLSGYGRLWFFERLTQVAEYMVNTEDGGEAEQEEKS